jgi:hypothetical protein
MPRTCVSGGHWKERERETETETEADDYTIAHAENVEAGEAGADKKGDRGGDTLTEKKVKP